MDIYSREVIIFRWIVFLMAAIYCVYRIIVADYSAPGSEFRFLTIWALFLSFFSASRMLAVSEQRITRRHEVTAMVAAVLNVMVVFLYWRLFFENPDQVNGRGEIIWHQQYYLHGLGPALQIIDALFVGRVFRRIHRAILPLLALIVVYVAFAELFVQRFNTSPSGSVTSGLPYPFLNNLEFSDRLVFYASNGAFALVVLGLFGGLAWGLRRSGLQAA